MHISDKIIRFLLLKIQILILFVLEKFICFIINLLKGIWEIFVIVRIDQNCKKLEETNILKKKRVKFTEEAINVLEQWFNSNIENPYPNRSIKLKLAAESNLTYTQVTFWLQNSRKKIAQQKKRTAIQINQKCSSQDVY